MSAAAVVLFLVGANAQAGWLYVIAAGFVGVVIAGMLAPAVVIRRVTAARDVQAVASVGDEIPVSVSLVNGSGGRRGPLAGTDMLFGPKTFLVHGLAPRETSTLVLNTVASRRGAQRGAPLKIETAAPFGIGKVSRVLNLESPIVVHPRWVRLAGFPLLESASTPNEALHERPRRGSGTDFFGLREYGPGDSLRRIHWRSSARTGNLLVREFEEHIGSRMSILLGSSVLGREPDTTFEAGMSCAASVVMYGLDAGHPVQLFCAGSAGIEHLFEPGKGEALDWMSRIEPEGTHGLRSLIDFATPEIFRRSTNVIIFPTDRRSASEVAGAILTLQDMATRVIAIAISARSYDPAGPVLAEEHEQELFESLGATRVIVYLVEKGKELSECLSAPLPG